MSAGPPQSRSDLMPARIGVTSTGSKSLFCIIGLRSARSNILFCLSSVESRRDVLSAAVLGFCLRSAEATLTLTLLQVHSV